MWLWMCFWRFEEYYLNQKAKTKAFSSTKMEDFAMEWNDICRVCLQDGDLISFYTKDDCDITICEKIMYCAAVNVSFVIHW